MKFNKRFKQSIVFLLAFLMAFEPFAINMVYAKTTDDIRKAEVGDYFTYYDKNYKISTKEELNGWKTLITSGSTTDTIIRKNDLIWKDGAQIFPKSDKYLINANDGDFYYDPKTNEYYPVNEGVRIAAQQRLAANQKNTSTNQATTASSTKQTKATQSAGYPSSSDYKAIAKAKVDDIVIDEKTGQLHKLTKKDINDAKKLVDSNKNNSTSQASSSNSSSNITQSNAEAKQVENSTKGVANAKVNDWIIRDDGTKIILKAIDIELAQKDLAKEQKNSKTSENTSTNQANSNSNNSSASKKYKVGDTITGKDGKTYKIIENSYEAQSKAQPGDRVLYESGELSHPLDEKEITWAKDIVKIRQKNNTTQQETSSTSNKGTSQTGSSTGSNDSGKGTTYVSTKKSGSPDDEGDLINDEKIDETKIKIIQMDGDSDDIEEAYNKFKEMLDDGQFMKPVDYLDYVYATRGMKRPTSDNLKTYKQGAEAYAYAEWVQMLAAAYAAMDDGSTDVIAFYDTIGTIIANATILDAAGLLVPAIKTSSKMAVMLVHSIGNAFSSLKELGSVLKVKVNMFKGFKVMNKLSIKALNFASKTEVVPTTFRPVSNLIEVSDSASKVNTLCLPAPQKTLALPAPDDLIIGKADDVDYVVRSASKASDVSEAANVSKVGKIAKVNKASKIAKASNLSVALSVIGIVFDAICIFTSDDFQGGRVGSYDLTKHYVSVALGLASLIPGAVFITVPAMLIWMALTSITDLFGKFNQKWRTAYRDSFAFLYEYDKNFKSFYDTRETLTKEEKSSSYIYLEDVYGIYKEIAEKYYADYNGKPEYYDNNDLTAKNSRMYLEMEKQGVLTSYYHKNTFDLPSFNPEDEDKMLEKMWRAKADYMAWKPTQEEKVRAENRGFWGNVLYVVDPIYHGIIKDTFVNANAALNKLKLTLVNGQALRKASTVSTVHYNPDFVLIKKYMNYLTAYRRMTEEKEGEANNNSFYQILGLRIEQTPFNYIPLALIDMSEWAKNGEELLIEAFNGDAFIVGVKELMYLRNIIRASTSGANDFTKQIKKDIKEAKKSIKIYTTQQKALLNFFDLLDNPATRNKSEQKYFTELKKALKTKGWDKKAYGKVYTPVNILKAKWHYIYLAMQRDSMLISQLGANLQLYADSILKNKNLSIIMNHLYEEKQEAYNNFDNNFKNESINKYIKENKFLGVGENVGDIIMNYFGDGYSYYNDLDKYNTLYKKEVNNFAKEVDEHDDEYSGYTIFKAIEEINLLLEGYKEVLTRWENTCQKLGLNDDEYGLTIKANDIKVFPEGGYETLESVGTISLDDDVVDPDDEKAMSAISIATDND